MPAELLSRRCRPLARSGLTHLFEQISGSDAFKAEYENLEKEKLAADERLTFNLAKKRTAAADRKAKKEQKDEAERHIKLQEELH